MQFFEKNITPDISLTTICTPIKRNQIDAEQLVRLFQRTFGTSLNTYLVSGGAEPEYIPVDAESTFHRIIFTRDYCSSALHEIAHWCIAGEARRLMRDYGYWYVPDGRNASQQSEFEQVEVKPQALEWLFSTACDIQFKVSADNLDNDVGISPLFKKAIAAQARAYCDYGLNARAIKWINALVGHHYQMLPNTPNFHNVVNDKVLNAALYMEEAL
ncbi:MAG: elongation factor P hydroxylase [Cellvibrionaceae bacterium]